MAIQEELEKLYQQIDNCKQCPLGSLDVNQPPRPRFKAGTKPILIIGQNPSVVRDPDRNWVYGGLDVLFHYISIQKLAEVVWITNLVKCSTLQNRHPKANEIKACLPWLKQELKIIKPIKIITLGKLASKWLRREYNILEFEHPSYVIRFKFRNLEAYTSKLKEAMQF